MMQKTILCVEFTWPVEDVEYVDFDSETSLLDGDIIVFDPAISSFTYKSGIFQGKPSLKETDSFHLLERSEHWRRELLDALHAGKTIFIFLNSLQEVFVDSGQRKYSGTGRNRKTTRMMDSYKNYWCIPVKLNPVNSKGRSMKLSKGSELIANYWKDFGSITEYKVKLEEELKKPLVVTKEGNKILGAHILSKNGGNLIFLPYFDFNNPDYSYLDKDESFWSPKAINLGKRLLHHIIEIDKAVRKYSEVTPTPEWANDPSYVLPREHKLREKLLQVETHIGKLNKDKESIISDLADEGAFRRLLYEKGKPLEFVIIETLKLMGFKAEPYHEADSEFDVVFESKEGRFLGEAEGKDSKAINIDKLRQLQMNIHEDFARDEVKEMSLGVLFGNAYRLKKPNMREVYFTTKCISAAKRSGFGLVRTPDMFPISQYLSSKHDKRYATRCRNAILNTKGDIVDFPPVPKAAKSKMDVATKEDDT